MEVTSEGKDTKRTLLINGNERKEMVRLYT